MKRMAFAALIAVAGCGERSPEQVQADKAADVLVMLRNGDGAACNNPATIETVRRIVFGDRQYGGWTDGEISDFQQSLTTGLEMVTLEGVDTATSEVRCAATFFATWNGEGGTAPIQFSIKPTLDTEDFMVWIFDTRGPASAVSMAVSAYWQANVRGRQEATQQQNERMAYWDRGRELCGEGKDGNEVGRDLWLGDQASRGKQAADDGERATVQCLLDIQAQITRDREREAAENARRMNTPPPREDRIEYVAPPQVGGPVVPDKPRTLHY